MTTPYSEGFVDRLVKLAAKPKLDIQVCDHCNLRCAGCLHFAPLAEKRFLDLGEYERDLRKLATIEGIGRYFGTIVLMGGEPLLHPHVTEVARMTRAIFPDERVSLCTNGLLLRRMDDEFWDALVECNIELAISSYPLPLDYDGLAALAHTKGAQVFFTSDITGTVSGKEAFVRLALDPDGRCDPACSFTSCPFGGHFLQLSRGAIWPCQVSAHHGVLARRFGYDMHDSPGDSLSLDTIESVDDIESFRRRSHPMCRYCDNDALTVMPWEQSKFEASEWLS